MKNTMRYGIECITAIIIGLGLTLQAANAIPYTSWHAVFVHLPGEGTEDATAMKNKFDEWKWGPESSPKNGWDTAIFPADKIVDAFQWLRDRQGENEILVFYYAGHGDREISEDNKTEESSTEDTPPPSEPAIDEADEGVETSATDFFSDDQIGDELRNISGYTVSMFDACYSGGMVDGAKDINGKKKDGSNKENETVIMGSREYETCLTRNGRGVFTEYFLKEFPKGDPDPETFSTWWSEASTSYRTDYKKNPKSFDRKFQSFQLTEYSDGEKETRYKPRTRNGLPEPSPFMLLGSGLFGLIVVKKLARTAKKSEG